MEFGKTLIKTNRQLKFVSIQYDDLPKQLRSNVFSDITIPIRNEAEPFESAPPARLQEGIGARVHVFAARERTEDDLVRCQWTHLQKSITVTLSRNARRFDFDLREVPGCNQDRGLSCVSGIRSWVESIVATEGVDRFGHAYSIKLLWSEALPDGTHFSSAPDLDIKQIRRWHSRVDAEVSDGVLSLFIYKRFQHIQGGYQDGAKWFDDAFRRKVLNGP